MMLLSFEDMIAEDNSIRIIDALVESFDMQKLGCKYAKTTGREKTIRRIY